MYTNVAVIVTITEPTRIPMTTKREGRIYVIQMMFIGFRIGCCSITAVFVAVLVTAMSKSVVVTFSLNTLVTAAVLVDTDGVIAVQIETINMYGITCTLTCVHLQE